MTDTREDVQGETEMTMIAQDQRTSGQPAAKRAPRLSPELNEFLHMLDSLEGQFSGPSRQVQ